MSRLDRLGPAKEIAQIGATIGREFSDALMVAVAGKPEAELQSALGRLIAAGLLFRQGVPPHATYLFKHALVQDAAYGTLLREPRRTLHARIAETLESQFAEIAENRPELLARHCSEAGLIEKAAVLWAKAGQQSLERSALVEAVEQLTRALDQMSSLPEEPELLRAKITVQVALLHALGHVKGFAAPETKAAVEAARSLIEQARTLGEAPPRLFSVLFGAWVTNYIAFSGDQVRELASQFLALAERQKAPVPLMNGHRLMGTSLLSTGEILQGRAHLDQAIRALRSRRPSSPGNAFWPRPTSGDLVISILGTVDAWSSSSRSLGRAPDDQGCARDRPHRYADVCATPCINDEYLVWELFDGNQSNSRDYRSR